VFTRLLGHQKQILGSGRWQILT